MRAAGQVAPGRARVVTGGAVAGMVGEMTAGALLALWDGRLSTVARNLTDLNDSDAMLLTRAGLAGDRPWTGRTRAEAEGVAAAMDGLWQVYLALSAAVGEARDASRRLGFPAHRDAEVRRFLDGPSVGIPRTEVPVGARGLLDPVSSDDRLTPEEALRRMSDGFDAARSAIASVAAARDGLAGRVADLEARIDGLAAWQAATPRDAPHAALPAAGAAWGASSDPLGSAAELDRVEAAVVAAESARRREESEAAAFAADASAVRSRLDVMAATEADLATVVDALVAAVDCEWTVARAGEAARLSAWLDDVVRAAARGRTRAAAIGLGKLSAEAAACASAVAGALAAARRPLAELEDMRGWFRALRAKSAAAGNDAARACEARAKEELRRVPVRLAVARRLVDEFERALAAHPAKGPAQGDGR